MSHNSHGSNSKAAGRTTFAALVHPGVEKVAK